MQQLLDLIGTVLGPQLKAYRLCLPASAGELRAKLFNTGAVREEQIQDSGGWIMDVELDNASLHQLCLESNLDVSQLQKRHTPN